MQPREATLSSLPATAGQRRWAAAVVIASAVVFLAAAPFARVPLSPVYAFIPSYQSALVVNDLVTAALLFGQLRFFRSRALLLLAGGYLFTALMACAHALTFPGLFAPAGLLGAGPQTTAWLYMFWHGGFPLFVIAYARLPGQFQRPRAIVGCIAATLAAACLLVLAATAGHDALPPIMSGNRYTPAMLAVVTSVWVLSLVAVAVLWRQRPHTVLDMWLMVVMWAWVFDIALAAVLNAGRFDLGFYLGRAYGLIAATLVLVVLLLENGKLYGELRQKNEEIERARQAAVEAARARGAFLATMSHEIRTPMGGVMGMLELLSLTKLDGEQRTMLGIVRESGQSLLRIIDDILNFSRLEAGKLELRPEPTSIAALVEGVRDFYSGNASAKGLALKHHVDPGIGPALKVDPVRLGQILNNLVANAIKFTAAGEVTIRAELAARHGQTDVVRFLVQDTGIGVAPEEAARLFQPFVQAGGGSPAGSGLGLSICRRLAAVMGGTLAMDSEPGVGTRMLLTLPLERMDEAAIAVVDAHAVPKSRDPMADRDAARSVEPGVAEGALILVVDDHPINRIVLSKQIESIGYATEAAASGEEALAKLGTGRFAAVVTDCHMPQMSGYELARHIRASEAPGTGGRMPIIACTANAMEGGAEACYGAGMDDLLTKPVDLARLRGVLRRWLTSPGPMDRAVLADLSGGSPAVERELVARFWTCTHEDARALLHAIGAGDIEGVARAAHRILGATRSIGAEALAVACEGLERAARAQDWATVNTLREPFEREVQRIRSHAAAMGLSP